MPGFIKNVAYLEGTRKTNELRMKLNREFTRFVDYIDKDTDDLTNYVRGDTHALVTVAIRKASTVPSSVFLVAFIYGKILKRGIGQVLVELIQGDGPFETFSLSHREIML
jgi:hypothetical protein